MKITTWVRAFVIVSVVTAAVSVLGCNIYNPSGAGDAGPDAHLAQGQKYYQDGEFAKAMASFQLAIAQDSTNSRAYYGYAKSVTKFFQLDKIGILNDLDSARKDTTERIYFLKENDPGLMTNRLRALEGVRAIMKVFEDRDTLTRAFHYMFMDSTSFAAQDDPDFAARKAYMEEVYFVNADLGVPGYRKLSDFPLTDRRMPFEYIVADMGVLTTVHGVTRLYDFDRNGIIDFSTRDSFALDMGFGKTGGFGGLDGLAGSLEEDSTMADDVNALLSNLSGDMSNASAFISMFQTSDSGSTDGEKTGSEQSQANTEEVVNAMGETITFFFVGDKLDNDGDGCVDEEIWDGKDNDFDGFVDEDARKIPTDKPDGTDNDLDGKKDPVNPPSPFPAGDDSLGNEALVGDLVNPTHPYVLGFVQAYLAAKNELMHLPQATSWVNIKKDDDQMHLRMNVQKDSLFTKRLPNGRLPDSLTAKLQNAKTTVGGCWPNYKTQSEAP